MGFASLYPSYGTCARNDAEDDVGPADPRNKNGGPFGPPLMRM
jgi:hypothetical protein